MSQSTKSGHAQIRLREYLDDALMRWAQYQELGHYPLPDDLQPQGIATRLAELAVALLPDLAPQDTALERSIIDLYDARRLPVEDFEQELRRIQQMLGTQPRAAAPGRRLRHIFTAPVALPVEIRICRNDGNYPYDTWPYIRIGAGHGNARYWRIPTLPLLEIGLSLSGRLRLIEVITFRGPLTSSMAGDFAAIPEQAHGVPVFGVDLWDDRDDYTAWFCDVVAEWVLELRDDWLLIRLYPDSPAYRVVISERFSCEFNQMGELCSLSIRHLTDEETVVLRKLAARNAR